MKIKRFLIITMLLIAIMSLTTGIALADDLPPPEDPIYPEGPTEPEERSPGQNPVAWFLSQYFNEVDESDFVMEYEDIMELHETYGFGNLARAFFLYSTVDNVDLLIPDGWETPEDEELPENLAIILAARENSGWGVLYKILELPRNKGSLGWAFKNAEEADKPGKGPKWVRTDDDTDDPYYDPYDQPEPYDPYPSGGTEVTVSGNKPDKPDKPLKPGRPENPGKSDQAGKKDKKTKDK